MSIEAMKQALDALEEHGTHYARHEDNYIKAITALREAIEFQEMVAKGTKAWADTPDDWVDDLRGGAEAMKQAVAWAKFNQGEITHSEMTDGSGCDFDSHVLPSCFVVVHIVYHNRSAAPASNPLLAPTASPNSLPCPCG